MAKKEEKGTFHCGQENTDSTRIEKELTRGGRGRRRNSERGNYCSRFFFSFSFHLFMTVGRWSGPPKETPRR